MEEKYDASWDLDKTEEGGEDAFERKFREWEKRDWIAWLKNRLVFPFQAERMEDDDDFMGDAPNQPFGVGQTMDVIGLSPEDDAFGIIVQVKRGKRRAYVPLADLEVTSKEDRNYWPVREHVVWYANRST